MIYTITINPAIDRTVEVAGPRIGALLKGRLIAERPAGKGINVSLILAALGVESVALGLVGKDDAEAFRTHLAARGVKSRMTVVPGNVRRSTTIVDADGGPETHLREAGPSRRPDDLEPLIDAISGAFAEGDIGVIAGSLPDGLAPVEMRRIIAAIGRRGARAAVDSSGEALAAAIDTCPWLVKPNREELAALTGRSLPGRGDVARATLTLAERVEIVAVSLGAEGALLAPGDRPGEILAADAPQIEAPRSSVGCGDAFLAGILAIAEGRGPRCALASAVACGSAALESPTAGEIDPRRVALLASQVEVAPLRT